MEWVANRFYSQLLTPVTNNNLFLQDDLKSMVPEFKKATWSQEDLSKIDFSDDNKNYKWPKAGLAWSNALIGATVHPTPAHIIDSSLLHVVEKDYVGRRKTSVDTIKELNRQEFGVKSPPFEIKVVCTQVPENLSEGHYVLIWLGSDNSKGQATEWKHGFKAIGKVLVVKAALIHNQFEMIHPFLDGNSRVERLLIAFS